MTVGTLTRRWLAVRLVRNKDFPILKSQGKIVGDRSKDKHIEIEQDSVDAELSVQKDMRNVWSMVERGEQLIGEIVNKLRNEWIYLG